MIALVLMGAFVALALFPITTYLLSLAGLEAFAPAVDGSILAVLLWAILAALTPHVKRPPRAWGRPTVWTVMGLLLVILAWTDPMGIFARTGDYLAGDGALEGFFARVGRGAATFLGIYVLLTSLRPTETVRTRRAAREAKQQQAKQAKREKKEAKKAAKADA